MPGDRRDRLEPWFALGKQPTPSWAWAGPASALGMLGLAATSLLWPPAAPLALVAGCALGWERYRHRATYPMKRPMAEAGIDPHDLNYDGTPRLARGSVFLGTDMQRGKDVWATQDDARLHFVVMGGMGAGRDDALLGFAANALSVGGGFAFVDGRSDGRAYHNIVALSRQYAREQDVHVVNLTHLTEAWRRERASVDTNRMGLFASFPNSSPSGLASLLLAFADGLDDLPVGVKSRLDAYVAGLFGALCWLRDHRGVELSPAFLSEKLDLDAATDVATDEDIPASARKQISFYLESLPGFSWDRASLKKYQHQSTLDVHAQVTLPLFHALHRINDDLGGVCSGSTTDIDLGDIVRNRRILVVLIPDLSCPRTTIFVSELVRAMVLSGFSASVTDGGEDDVGALSSRGRSGLDRPFSVILNDVMWDETPLRAAKTFHVCMAQARSAGISFVIGIDQVPERGEAAQAVESMIANACTRILMRAECPNMERRYRALAEGYAGFNEFRTLSESSALIVQNGRAVWTKMFVPLLGDNFSRLAPKHFRLNRFLPLAGDFINETPTSAPTATE